MNFVVSQEASGEILHVNEDRSVTQRCTVVYLFVHHCMKAILLEELSKPFVAIPHKRGCQEVIRKGFSKASLSLKYSSTENISRFSSSPYHLSVN